MNLLFFDTETKDPGIRLGIGPAWVYALNNSNMGFKVLGYSYCFNEGDARYEIVSEESVNQLKALLNACDGIVCHNAQYDLGSLLYLGIDISKLIVYDTKVMGHLHNNTLYKYSLQDLSDRYLSEEYRKNKQPLVDAVIALEGIKQRPDTKTYIKKALNWAYENMDILSQKYPDLVAEYAKQDVIATRGLFNYFVSQKDNPISLRQAEYWSRFQLICTLIRKRGIKIDISAIRSGMDELEPLVNKFRLELKQQLGVVNLESPIQLANVLRHKGYALPKTEKGAESTSKTWLEEHRDDPTIDLLVRYRQTYKLYKDFLQKMLEIQQYSCPEALLPGAKYGRIHPELNLFGARTGRFSSSSPNIQQIPKKDRSEYSHLIRNIFIPDNDSNNWYSADWSSQESRILLHYAKLIKSVGADELVNKFIQNPNLDLHQDVAEMAGLDRVSAKTINLGLGYGMGSAKLARSLGLSTEYFESKKYGKIEVAGKEGMKILNAYNSAFPHIKNLREACQQRIKAAGKIVTIGGRCLRRDNPRFDYKALNMLIQGSAADQCLAALLRSYEEGLDVIALIHDEIAIEGNMEDAFKLKQTMETCIPMSIPFVAKVSGGNSWGELKEIDL